MDAYCIFLCACLPNETLYDLASMAVAESSELSKQPTPQLAQARSCIQQAERSILLGVPSRKEGSLLPEEGCLTAASAAFRWVVRLPDNCGARHIGPSVATAASYQIVQVMVSGKLSVKTTKSPTPPQLTCGFIRLCCGSCGHTGRRSPASMAESW
ncbi:unnamed protein product [Symbiodinium sp. CCMP2592]|nr:unnamed protein product [Symbiodinium sp. CCMP2592]